MMPHPHYFLIRCPGINLESKFDTRYSLSPKWLEHAGFSGRNQLLALINHTKTTLRSSCSSFISKKIHTYYIKSRSKAQHLLKFLK